MGGAFRAVFSMERIRWAAGRTAPASLTALVWLSSFAITHKGRYSLLSHAAVSAGLQPTADKSFPFLEGSPGSRLARGVGAVRSGQSEHLRWAGSRLDMTVDRQSLEARVGRGCREGE